MHKMLEDMIQDIVKEVRHMGYVRANSIPNIDLYMDQVTTFMEERLDRTKRYDDDKILTKTMINNYAKNNLVPPPLKKKYNKEHMMILLFVYYYKNILSIGDIEKLLLPITERFYQSGDDSLGLEDVYEGVFDKCAAELPAFMKDVNNTLKLAGSAFSDAPEEDRDYLQLFTYICLLSQDVYMKTKIIEKLIDTLPDTKDGADLKK